MLDAATSAPPPNLGVNPNNAVVLARQTCSIRVLGGASPGDTVHAPVPYRLRLTLSEEHRLHWFEFEGLLPEQRSPAAVFRHSVELPRRRYRRTAGPADTLRGQLLR